MKTTILLTALFLMAGCSRGLDRILHGPAPVEGTPYVAPVGDLTAVPVYDQSTATSVQDENLIRRVIGNPTSNSSQIYIHEALLPNTMNGIHNLATGSTGYSSILVDAIKALYRRGYVDVSKVNDPGVLTSNKYPVPVYQDDRTRWGV